MATEMYEELVKILRLRAALWEKMYDENNVLKQAADAIEELSREYESVSESLCESIELVQKIKARENRWIPVTERLPEEDGEYLTWFRVDDSEPSFGIFPFDANVPAFGYWDDYYDPVTYGWAGSDFIEVKGVTHWMPLPEPPKEETE